MDGCDWSRIHEPSQRAVRFRRKMACLAIKGCERLFVVGGEEEVII